MTALLTDHLPLLAGAPNGIKKLRELILELAVRGKLVPQDEGDEPASEFIKRISEEKKRMATDGVISHQKSPAEITDEEKTFKLPEGWSWQRFADFAADVSTGPFGSLIHKSDYVDGGVPLINPSHMIDGRIVPDESVSLSTKMAETMNAYRLHAGDMVMARRGEVGRVALVTERERGWLCGTGSFVLRFTPEVSRLYVWILFRCSSVRNYLTGAAVGTTMVNLNHGILQKMPIAVPPLPEQHRIVAKVDELMALCDRMEARQAHAESAHAQLVEALLGSLTQSRDANDFATSWQRLSNHFHTLFTTEPSIEALKQSVLQLAVVGKLVPQNPRDEHAIELLKDIQSSRADKREIVTLEDVPSSKRIPDCWVWSSVDQLSADDPRAISDGPFGASLKTEHYIDSPGFRVVRLQNIGNGEFRDEHRAYISSDHFEKIIKHQIFPGDLVVAGLIDVSIRCCLVPNMGPAVVKADCYRFSTHPSVSRNYVLYYLNSKSAHAFAAIHHHGLTLTRIGLGNFRTIPVPLPPLEEQHRIVAKVDQLMTLCDQLKSRMVQARELSQELTKAMIQKALEAGPASRTYREQGGEVVHLASYLVSKMSASPTFGRVALMKGIYLADQHLGLELVEEYERMAAGPFTDEVYEVERSAAERDWFSHARMKSDKDRVIYKPGKNITQATDVLREALGEARAELDRLIALLANKPTDDVEMIATLYAVWADALAKGVPIDDDLLVHEVRNHWHESKLRFPPQTLKHWLAWMRENQLVPTETKRHAGRQSSLKLA